MQAAGARPGGTLCNSMQMFQEAGGMEWAAKQGGGRLSGRAGNALDEANLYLYKNVEVAGLVADARSHSLHFMVCPCCFTFVSGLQKRCPFQRGQNHDAASGFVISF